MLIEGEKLNKQEGSVWIRRGGGSPAVAIPLGDVSRGNEMSETIDRYCIRLLTLCCQFCIFQATYKAEEVLFLLDDEDTVNFYEESGMSHQPSSSAPVQRELEALSSLDRVVRTEMVHGKLHGSDRT